MGILEILTSSRSIYDEWYAGDYFESGLYTGKVIVSGYFTVFSILKKHMTS